ncbi:MAG: glycosyltransferase [Bacteroidales bacterium]|nr:glycosyltransferase [Bacteroidales bacterium]
MQIVDIHYKCIFAIEMSRILLLADINSAHLKKWAKVLHEGGHALGIFSLSKATNDWYIDLNIELLSDSGFDQDTFRASQTGKMVYFKKRSEVKLAIKKFKPDFFHAHYASSYGLLGALSKFHPYYISVWGSDILLFPSNAINRKIIRYNFRKADKIIVSSKILKKESAKFTKKDIDIIPFGIDTELFKPLPRQKRDKFVIGTVKSLELIYGIDILIKAFAIVKKSMPDKEFELHLIGSGNEKDNFQKLAQSLNVSDSVKFLNHIKQSELPEAFNQFDIAVYLSRSESFGVSILEASACEIPVVVSATGGLLEVVDNGTTGFHTEPENVNKAAEKIITLINDKELRTKMGKAGRLKVIREYTLENTKAKILALYQMEGKS